MIRLERISGKNIWDILKLHVSENQKSFVAPNDVSILEAYIAQNENGHAYPFGIFDNEIPVGFCMVGYGTDDSWEDAPDVAKDNYNIWRFMIDRQHQGKGYGKAAMKLVLDFIASRPCGPAELCWLSYEPGNDRARALYADFGFEETGEYDGEEIIAVRPLEKTCGGSVPLKSTELNDASAVKKQYASSANLDTRISIHEKYSTNPQGFGNWIADHYQFPPLASVLELGCGTGSFWLNQEQLVRSCSELILSDFSEGMIRKARETLACYNTIRYRAVDIQDIPFPEDSFDIVIANMMLYHVPDLHKGLDEVRRVLKPGGTFYCATYGENGIMEYLCRLLGKEDCLRQANHSFTLQNGAPVLLGHFDEVQRFDYPDSLAVTDAADLADYIGSLAGMAGLRNMPREEIISVLNANMVNGVLSVPKEYGMFAAK